MTQQERLGLNGITYGAKELYPHSNAWGTRGWTFPNLPEAEAKYTTLLAQRTAHA